MIIKNLIRNPILLLVAPFFFLLVAIFISFFQIKEEMEKKYQMKNASDKIALMSLNLGEQIQTTIKESNNLSNLIEATNYLTLNEQKYDFLYGYLKDKLLTNLNRKENIESISLTSITGKEEIKVSRKGDFIDEVEIIKSIKYNSNNIETTLKIGKNKSNNKISILISTPIKSKELINKKLGYLTIELSIFPYESELLLNKHESIILTNINSNEPLLSLGSLNKNTIDKVLYNYSKNTKTYFNNTIVEKRDINNNIIKDEKIIINAIDVLEGISIIHAVSYDIDTIGNTNSLLIYFALLCVFISIFIYIIKESISRLINSSFYEITESIKNIEKGTFSHLDTSKWKMKSINVAALSINKLGDKLKSNNWNLSSGLENDSVTGLLNRVSGIKKYKELISLSDDKTIYNLHIKINLYIGSKRIEKGNIKDESLLILSKRIKSTLENEFPETFNGDYVLSRHNEFEFLLILEANSEKIEIINTLLFEALNEILSIGSERVIPKVQIGLINYPENGKSTSELLLNGELLVNHLEETGKNIALFNKSMITNHNRKLIIKRDLSKAIKLNELELIYQPQFSIKGRRVIGLEALIRWKHPELGLILPEEFISSNSDAKAIIDMGYWSIEKACQQNKTWQNSGLRSIKISVNISIQQLLSEFFQERLEKILDKSGLDPKYLDLEIKDLNLFNEDFKAIEIIKNLKAIGISISIDGFGIGDSSILKLKNIDFDRLKLHKSLVKGIEHNKKYISIIKGIVLMGKELNTTILIEGIENEAQFKILKDINCDQVQGYMLSHPVPSHKVEKYFTTNISTLYDINKPKS